MDEFGEFRCKDAYAAGDADTYDVSGKDDFGEFWCRGVFGTAC